MLQSIVKADSYLHKGLRSKLIEQLRQLGIKNEQVLQAINQVPRHFFLDPAFEDYAYRNEAFQIGAGQTISQPYTVAYQTELLEVKKFDKIFEVGTGSAYQSCVLASLGALVYSVERQKELFDYNNHFFYLKQFPQIKRFFGDGFAGLPSYAPFDKAIITAAAPFVPQAIIDQLKVGGILVLPLDKGDGTKQVMHKIIKHADGIESIALDEFSFVPMLQGKDNRKD